MKNINSKKEIRINKKKSEKEIDRRNEIWKINVDTEKRNVGTEENQAIKTKKKSEKL